MCLLFVLHQIDIRVFEIVFHQQSHDPVHRAQIIQSHTTETHCPHLLFQYSNHHLLVSIPMPPSVPNNHINIILIRRPKYPTTQIQNTHCNNPIHAGTHCIAQPLTSQKKKSTKSRPFDEPMPASLFLSCPTHHRTSHWLAQCCKSTGNEYINDQHTQ